MLSMESREFCAPLRLLRRVESVYPSSRAHTVGSAAFKITLTLGIAIRMYAARAR